MWNTQRYELLYYLLRTYLHLLRTGVLGMATWIGILCRSVSNSYAAPSGMVSRVAWHCAAAEQLPGSKQVNHFLDMLNSGFYVQNRYEKFEVFRFPALNFALNYKVKYFLTI